MKKNMMNILLIQESVKIATGTDMPGSGKKGEQNGN